MMKPQLQDIIEARILVLDGAMGTMIQRYNLTEKQFRGERFENTTKLQMENNDLLSLSQPAIIEDIHREYLEAGADIIETNTFNANSISMEEYGMQSYVREMNIAATNIARKAANEFSKKNPSKPRFVAGAIGPTNKTASTTSQAAYKTSSVNFDDLRISYEEQIEALVDGGIDIVLIETVYDTLNAKAALFAAQDVFRKKEKEIPIIVSLTVPEKEEQTFSGETIEEFISSIIHIKLFSVGLNCSFGASAMKPHLKQLRNISSLPVTAYPNAGLPNQMGEYNDTPDKMANQIKKFIDEDLVSIVGGCCGTTPQHIAQIVKTVNGATAPYPLKR